jgi:hypothetical protein
LSLPSGWVGKFPRPFCLLLEFVLFIYYLHEGRHLSPKETICWLLIIPILSLASPTALPKLAAAAVAVFRAAKAGATRATGVTGAIGAARAVIKKR